MRKKIILIFVFFSLFFSLCKNANALCIKEVDDSLINVRISISNQNFSKFTYKNVMLTAYSPFELLDKSTSKVICRFNAYDIVNIEIKNRNFYISQNGLNLQKISTNAIEMRSEDGIVQIKDLKRKNKDALYKGKFEIVKNSKSNGENFFVVNVVDLKSYLKGVVPNEMPISFGKEALKAQSIAARNYALMPRTKIYKEFDLYDSTASQVYYGINTQQPISDLAVEQTNGIVALYNNDLILALYCSTNGGYSEHFENVFPSEKGIFKSIGSEKPYLKAISDNPYVPKLDSEGLATWYFSNNVQSFDSNSPYHRWELSWSKQELEDILKKRIKDNLKTGFIKPLFCNNKTDYGNLKNIVVTKRGESGKIMEMEVCFENAKFILQKELIIRRIFVNKNKMLPSANVFFDLESDENQNLVNIRAIGAGLGHGVGMSQFGASFMDTKGYSYCQILKHYYNGIKLGTIPIYYDSQNKNEQFIKQYFYSSTKNGKLIIEPKNLDNRVDIMVKVNNKEKFINLVPGSNYLVYDLNDLLKIGNNEVLFCFPNVDNMKFRIHIELESEKNNEF